MIKVLSRWRCKKKGYFDSLDAATRREQLIVIGRNDTKKPTLPVQITSENVF